MYTDHPKPSTAYLMGNITVLLFTSILGVCLPLLSNGPVWLRITEFVLFQALLLIALLLLHAAFRTEYLLCAHQLHLRSGLFMHETLPVNEIEAACTVPRPFRIIGQGPEDKGFCNRFGNGVLLETSHGAVYISPSSPDEFLARLQQEKNA